MVLQNSAIQTRSNFKILLCLIVIAAGIFRFALAPQKTLEGKGDTLLFQLWGYSAHHNGLTNVYEHSVDHPWFFNVARPNYLPPYMYVLWFLESVHSQFEPLGTVLTPVASIIYKTPAILFDLLLAGFLAWLVRKKFGDKWALVAAGIYAFHPAVIFESAGWGQIDSINTFFMVLCVWLMTKKKYLWATAVFTLAFFIKMQSIVLLPLLFYEIYKNSSIKTMFKAFWVGAGTVSLLSLPFFLAGKAADVFAVIFTSPGTYKFVSANAFNFWWLFSGGYWITKSDTQVFLGLQLITIGFLLFFAAVVFALWFRNRVKTETGLWLAAAFLAFAFFMLPTEMHERYLFPIFALLIPILPALKKVRWLFGILSLTFLWNLIAVFIILSQHEGRRLENFWGGSLFVAIVNLLVFILTITWYSQMAKKREPI
ncbi:DUF2029 domain-containing protein [Candidatus Parcubacteria bacterium]|jgi:Gpi18-like mannosyltransferase|nr:MAG: DUF2029 domain-containing protein [Candidatus Parcubacteria bacterium]